MRDPLSGLVHELGAEPHDDATPEDVWRWRVYVRASQDPALHDDVRMALRAEGDVALAAAVVVRAFDHVDRTVARSDWLQLQVAQRAVDPAVLHHLAQEGRTRRVRHLARRSLGRDRP